MVEEFLGRLKEVLNFHLEMGAKKKAVRDCLFLYSKIITNLMLKSESDLAGVSAGSKGI